MYAVRSTGSCASGMTYHVKKMSMKNTGIKDYRRKAKGEMKEKKREKKRKKQRKKERKREKEKKKARKKRGGMRKSTRT